MEKSSLKPVLSIATEYKEGTKIEPVLSIATEYKEEIENLSKEEVDHICSLLLSSGEYDTWTNKVIKFCTGQDELEDYQRVLSAPANGIENTISFFCSLLTVQGYVDLAQGLKSIPDSPRILKAIWDVFYQKLTPKQKLAVGVEFGSNVFVMAKAVVKLAKILKILKSLEKGALISKTQMARQALATSVAGKTVSAAEDLQDYGSVKKKNK